MILSPVVAQLPLFVAVLIARTDRKIVRSLRAAQAIDPARAVSFTPPGRIGRKRLDRMVRAGAVGAAGAGLYYLDEARYTEWRSARHRRAFIVLGMLLSMVGVLFAIGVFQ